MAENQIVASPSSIIALPAVSIYAIVDTSTSMKGSKIKSVCQGIKRMFTTWPAAATFHLTIFASHSKRIVTGRKGLIDIERVIESINMNCNQGGATALYDAWGDVLTSIPSSGNSMRKLWKFNFKILFLSHSFYRTSHSSVSDNGRRR